MSEILSNRPQLGLVCITASDTVRFRALTRKRLLQFDEPTQRAMLSELYADNLSRLDRALDFCIGHEIRLYRMTSGLFPFADDALGAETLTEFSTEIGRIGERATSLGIRLVVHPDQFVVLSSDSPHVIENSLKILRMHARNMDLLKQPRSSWATMILHGGKSDRAARLTETIEKLPDEIRSRLALENDEYCYSAHEILEVCRAAEVPMIFDAHHHLCHESLTSYDDASVGEFLHAARATWENPAWQLTHISNGRESLNDRHHSDIVTIMPESFRAAPWIEVEAKQKELAIEHLQQEWLPQIENIFS
ncbi:MAG: UV DNA damage repair endonuclease UvsE [Pyrinomonadaceae bacterium]